MNVTGASYQSSSSVASSDAAETFEERTDEPVALGEIAMLTVLSRPTARADKPSFFLLVLKAFLPYFSHESGPYRSVSR